MSSSVVLINSVNILFHSFLLKLKTLENSLLRDQMIFIVFGNSSHGVTFIIIGKVEDMLELLTELDCCPEFLIIPAMLSHSSFSLDLKTIVEFLAAEEMLSSVPHNSSHIVVFSFVEDIVEF